MHRLPADPETAAYVEGRAAEAAETNRLMAAVTGILVLAGPRRTRPLAAFCTAALLSRSHAAGRSRLEAQFIRLFNARTSVQARLDALDGTMREHVAELREDFERVREGQKINAEHADRVMGEIEQRLERRLSDVEDVLGAFIPRAWPDPGTPGGHAMRCIRDRVSARAPF